MRKKNKSPLNFDVNTFFFSRVQLKNTAHKKTMQLDLVANLAYKVIVSISRRSAGTTLRRSKNMNHKKTIAKDLAESSAFRKIGKINQQPDGIMLKKQKNMAVKLITKSYVSDSFPKISHPNNESIQSKTHC